MRLPPLEGRRFDLLITLSARSFASRFDRILAGGLVHGTVSGRPIDERHGRTND